MTYIKKLIVLAIVVILTFSFCISVFAHSGKTDADGGHYDHSTGEYHYHCGGNPAHTHKNGVCPYDKKGTTSSSSSSSSSCVSDIENTVCIVIIIGMIAFMVYAMFSKK